MVNWTVVIVAVISLVGSVLSARYAGHKALAARYHANRAVEARRFVAASPAYQAALDASMERHPAGRELPPVPAEEVADWPPGEYPG